MLYSNGTRGPLLSYPSSVYKQSKPELTKEIVQKLPKDLFDAVEMFIGSDFTIIFNSLKRWNFRDSIGHAFANDFKMVAAHLITRGLGFDSNLRYKQAWTFPLCPPTSELVIVPKFVHEVQNTRELGYMTSMDNLMYGPEPKTKMCIPEQCNQQEDDLGLFPISHTFNKFTGMNLHSRIWTRYKMNTVENILVKSIARQMYQIFNTGEVIVRFDDGSGFRIDSFIPDSTQDDWRSYTLGLVNEDWWDSLDFIMTYSGSRGFRRTLWEKMNLHNTTLLYGPLTLKMLQHVGYATASRPESPRFVS